MASFLQIALFLISISRSSLADVECLYTSCECARVPNNISENNGNFFAGQAEYPFIAILIANDEYRCAGSVITKRDIVTAAHCVYNVDRDSIKARVGVFDHPIASIVINEDYSAIARTNDIALLITADEIYYFTGNAAPVCLPVTSKLNPKLPFKHPDDFRQYPATVLGFSGDRNRPETFHDWKRVKLPIISNEICRQETGDTALELRLCLLDEEKKYTPDDCVMDSGGPILWHTDTNNRLQLIGFVTGGSVCGGPMPSISTFIPFHLDWILEKLKEEYVCSAGFQLQRHYTYKRPGLINDNLNITSWQRYPFTSSPLES